MYVKFVWHLDNKEGVSDSQGNTEQLVVPTENQMFEAIDARWKKVRVVTQKQLDEFFETAVPCYVVNNVSSQLRDKAMEILHVVLTRRDNKNEEAYADLIACDCSMFIMNNDGKTIERVSVAS